ncbi:hypothetical protein BC830DRAFT_1087740 [Chytriomyces sp. MP71]|nr:hypothetical protein BC830DRAFT_1087740 [Chytriomyces sp. MP71]
MAAATAINMSLDDIISQDKGSRGKGASIGPDGLPRVARVNERSDRGRGSGVRRGRGAGAPHQRDSARNTPYNAPGGRAAAARVDTTRLNVSNLNQNVTEQDLRELFSTIGPVKSAVLNFDQHGKSKGNGTVIFKDGAYSQKAITEFNGRQFDGRPMRIELILSAASIANLSSAPPARGAPGGQRDLRGGARGGRGRGAGRGGRRDVKGPKKTPEELAAQLDAEMDKYMQDETMGDA